MSVVRNRTLLGCLLMMGLIREMVVLAYRTITKAISDRGTNEPISIRGTT